VTYEHGPAERAGGGRGFRLWAWGVVPLVLLAVLVGVFLWAGVRGVFQADVPPVEDLTIERVVLRPGVIMVHLVNGGPQPVTVSQVLVDEAYWQFTISPGPTVPRLGRATITLAYPWVEGETHHLRVLSATGVAFEHTIDVATATPTADARYLITFTMLGTFLILGFTIHNTTEGLAIVAPVSRDPLRLRALVALGALAGTPTIAGTWVGGLSFSPTLATLSLAVGAGAIFQVVYEIARLMVTDRTSPAYQTAGVIAGLLLMYLTGLLVAA
jgi:hypothetical protein